MEIKTLLQDEDAVSPVIGVILMVAITVILAAVIGTFVLGLGDQVQSSAPNSNFQFDYDEGSSADWGNDADEEIEITHNGGQDVDRDALTVQIGGTNYYEAGSAASVTGVTDVTTGDNWPTTVSTGDILQIQTTDGTDGLGVSGGDQVRVIWESDSGGSSNTIGSSTIPS